MTDIDLSKLCEPFPADDIEWRVSRAGRGNGGLYCRVLAYITARAISQRLDDVCGPGGWRNEPPQMIDVNGKKAFAAGISIRIGDEWVTKWDVADPTNIEPSKGGFSGAMKRAGAQWGIGRYLYHLDEAFAEVSEDDPRAKGWNYARLPENKGGGTYYWKTPQLPAWALPAEEEAEVSERELNDLKRSWRETFAEGITNRADLVDGFHRFVTSIVGEFPVTDHTCWTQDALTKCMKRIRETNDPNGVSSDVPFDK